MFVCMCRAVTLRTVEAAVEEGASTVRAVEQRCGAGGDCGSCRADIAAIIRAAREEVSARARAA